MYTFLSNNREDLIERCKAKVARRPARGATVAQLANGIPMFLEQLTRTLQAEEGGRLDESLLISGSAGGDSATLSEMGVTAAAHGKELLTLGYSVDQVVHDYGDLCQAITDLAVERDAPVSVDEFRTLNRCLDNAIADAVTEFGAQRDASLARRQSADENERLGELVHELRNVLQTATLAFQALQSGKLAIGGSTGGVLARSLASLSAMLDESLGEVRSSARNAPAGAAFSVAEFVAEAARSASLAAEARGCSLATQDVDPLLEITGDRERLMGALLNLLQNAFKFTHAGSEVALRARCEDERVLIDVADHCGGLPVGAADTMFKPFTQIGADRSGVGLGLSIARRGVEADGGFLTVRDKPGEGCVFTISLPRAPSTAEDAGSNS
jgi:signal transduction histidine kinase